MNTVTAQTGKQGKYRISEPLEPDFTGVPDEVEVCRDWNEQSRPRVSIGCIAFNQRQYIEETLRGFFMQRTRFPFHIVCYDDCSEDGTREVLEAYHARFPNLIKLILPSENQWSKGKKPFIDFLLPKMYGEYVVCCEADDYWTDPEKLQKQVDFLDSNKEFVLATHDVHTIDVSGNIVSRSHLPEFYKRHFSEFELRSGWAGPVTQAVMFRNILKEFPPEFHRAYLGDIFLWSLLGQFGAAAYIDDIKPSMYRLHSEGVFSSLSDPDKYDMQANTFFWIYKYYKRIGFRKEAVAFKMKMLEKHSRELGIREWIGLTAVRFSGANIKSQIDRLLRR